MIVDGFFIFPATNNDVILDDAKGHDALWKLISPTYFGYTEVAADDAGRWQKLPPGSLECSRELLLQLRLKLRESGCKIRPQTHP